jgi:hypothetical protein
MPPCATTEIGVTAKSSHRKFQHDHLTTLKLLVVLLPLLL